MPRNEEGEFELVLGNRQLLSVFFIVVVLLGVFFAMGLLMGRSGAQSTLGEMRRPENSPTERPMVVDAATSRPAAAGERVPPPEPDKPKDPEPVKPPEPKAEVKAEVKAEPKKEPKKPEVELPKPERKTAPPPPPAAAGGDPPPGSYYQVAWTNEAQAKVVAGIVAGKGHRAYLVPYKDLFRVIVGPAGGRDQQAKLLEDLKAEGFKPFPRKLP